LMGKINFIEQIKKHFITNKFIFKSCCLQNNVINSGFLGVSCALEISDTVTNTDMLSKTKTN
jgi:hypothetical protein